MFGLGTWEIAVILLVALLVLGPDKLPKMARTIGKGLREMRRATSELRMNIDLDEAATNRPVHVEGSGPPSEDPYAVEARRVALAEAEKAKEGAGKAEAEAGEEGAGKAGRETVETVETDRKGAGLESAPPVDGDSAPNTKKTEGGEDRS